MTTLQLIELFEIILLLMFLASYFGPWLYVVTALKLGAFLWNFIQGPNSK